VAYKDTIAEDVQNNEARLDNIEDDMSNLPTTINSIVGRVSKSELIGQYLTQTGVLQDNTSVNCEITDFLPCNGGDVFTIKAESGSANGAVAVFYKSDKSSVVGYNKSRYVNGFVDVTAPSTAIYVRFSSFYLVDSYKPLHVAYKDTIAEDVQNNEARLDNVESYIPSIENHWENKSWYAYGTSLTNISAEGKYASYLAKFSGLNLTNKGTSGGGFVRNQRLLNAVMNTTDGKTSADLITLECLATDNVEAFGEVTDTETTSFLGCLAQCIQYLQNNTTAQIVVIASAAPRSNTDGTEYYPPTHTYLDGNTWAQKRDKVQEVCKMYGVYFIDMEISLGYYRKTDDYLVDYIHHTELGGYVVASYIWSQLKNIPLWYTAIPE
jgi:hypothetical protein